MDQAGAGVQDIRRHQVGDGAVQPVPAGNHDTMRPESQTPMVV